MRVTDLPFLRPALICFLVSLLSFLSLLGCTTDADPQSEQDQLLRMNEIQVLGTHNSYHIQPRDSILEALVSFTDQETADSLEYTALPLKEQFDHGVRQLELDVFADPEGGMYAMRGVSSWSVKTPCPACRNWTSPA